MEIDDTKLPDTAMVDTSVLIGAFDPATNSAEPAACRAFIDAMLKARKRVVAAAPALAEFLRGGDSRTVPRIRGFVVLPFDERSALFLAKELPVSELRRFKGRSKVPLDYFKYDALIVATGAAHGVEYLVTTDDRQAKLAASVGIQSVRPASFQREQSSFEDLRPGWTEPRSSESPTGEE